MSSPPKSEQRSQSAQVVRSAGIVSVAIALSRVTGLVREMVMAQKFGAGAAYDAFLLGFRIPNLTRNLFEEGALSSAFVPTFAAYLDKGDRSEAVRLSNLLGTAMIVIVGGLCLLGVIFSPQLVAILAPGYRQTPGKFDLAVLMTRIMLPFLLLVALAAQAMGMLNANGQFGAPALAASCFNVGSVVLGLMFGFWLGPHIGISPIEGMAYGVLAGGVLQLSWQILHLRPAGFTFHFDFRWNHSGLQRIFRLMIPAILGNAAVQVNVMVNTNFASQILDPVRGADGPVSWLGYAFRFVQMPVGLFGVAFASAVLPSVSRSASAGNIEEFRTTLSHALGTIFLMTIPSSVGLIVLGRPMIGAVFQSGKFQIYDTHQTALALAFYSIGLAGYSAAKVLDPAFYALNDANTPMYISLLSICLNLMLSEIFMHTFHLGISGLALSTSVVAIAACVALFWQIRKRLGSIDGLYILRRLLIVSAASTVMAVAIYLAHRFVTGRLGESRGAYIVDLGICLPLGVVTFAAAASLLGIEEMRGALRVAAGRARGLMLGVRARILDK